MEEIAELVRSLDELIASSEDAMISAIRSLQDRVASGLVSRAGALEVKRDGTLRANRKNRRLLRGLKKELVKLVQSQSYLEAVDKFKEAFDNVERLNATYFQQEFSTFRRTMLTDISSAAKDRAGELLTTNPLNAGLVQPINEIIDGYLSGGTRQSLIDSFRANIPTSFTEQDGVLGIDRTGYLERNSGRYVRDSLNIHSRSMSDAMVNATGAEWIAYLGGTVRDTRDFCQERNGNFYHIDEVRSWASLQWQGRNSGTNESNILQLLGGYNCRHSAIAVSIDRVPQEDRDRIA